MQRLKTRAQFEAAMAGGTVSRTAHFVLHRASLAAQPSVARSPEGPPPGPAGSLPVSGAGRGPEGPKVLFAVDDEPWIGAVVPKRWARRAVTRNGIKRQIYTVSAAFAPRLPAAAHVVRLRTEFARKEFTSAWSEALKAVVRSELQQLFDKVAQRAAPAPAAGGESR